MTKELLTGAIGALLGAWGGAHAIQLISERAARKEGLRKEVVRTNAAIGHVHMLLGSFLNLKEQFFRPMEQCFLELETVVHEIELAGAEGRRPRFSLPAVVPTALLIGVVWPRIDVGRVDRIVSEELTIVGRPQALAGALVQDSAGLEALVKERSLLIDRVEAVAGVGGLQRRHFEMIFGLPNTSGGIDVRFRSNLQNVVDTNDGCIHFCRLLIADLQEHGRIARERYLRQFKGPVPEITEGDYTVAESKGLFPDPKPYATWETSFKKRPIEEEYYGFEKWRRAISQWAHGIDFVALAKTVVAVAGIGLILVFVWRVIEKNILGQTWL